MGFSPCRTGSSEAGSSDPAIGGSIISPEIGMRDFDEDRPSISGRKIASNIPPTVPGYEQFRPWFKWLLAIFILPVLFMLVLVFFFR